MLSRIFLSWGRKFPWDQPAHELPVLLRATSTAVNPVCTIIHPSEGGSEDSVWKWIWKAQMEPHGANPRSFSFAKATTRSRWREPTGGWVVLGFTWIAFPQLPKNRTTASSRLEKTPSLFPSASGGIKHDGEDLLRESIRVILIFVFAQKEKKLK